MQTGTAVEKFCKGYFATSARSHHTRRAYEGDLEQFSSFVRPDLLLEAIDTERVEEWSHELRRRNYAPASCKRKLASLRIFLQYWVRMGVLDSSPMSRLRFNFGPTLKLPKTLDRFEMKSLLQAAQNRVDQIEHQPNGRVGRGFIAVRNLAILRLLFATGIRVGEASALNLDDFCARECSFRIAGKGGWSRMAFLAAQKAIDCHHRYLKLRVEVRTESSAFFLNKAGRRLSTQGIAYSLRVLADSVSLGRKLTPHMLRHTAATFLLRNGADIRIVQEFLGHASILTTQRYTHVTKEDLVSTLRHAHPDLAVPVERQDS